jgi:hypothetical protein
MKTIASKITLQYDEKGLPILLLSLTDKSSLNELQELKKATENSKQLSVEIKQYRQKRSLDANGYMWILCQKIAEVIPSTKELVYQSAIRDVGQFEMLAVQESAAEQFISVWNSRGLGWYAEEMDSKIPGCKKIVAYYGSSCYDTHAMSVLIDYIVSEAKNIGVETLTPAELSRMKQEWGNDISTR